MKNKALVEAMLAFHPDVAIKSRSRGWTALDFVRATHGSDPEIESLLVNAQAEQQRADDVDIPQIDRDALATYSSNEIDATSKAPPDRREPQRPGTTNSTLCKKKGKKKDETFALLEEGLSGASSKKKNDTKKKKKK